MPAQFFPLNVGINNGPGTAVNTFTTATDISPTPQFSIPGSYIPLNGVLRITASGVFSVVTATTPTLSIGVYWGGASGVSLGASLATATASGVTNVPWRLEWIGTVTALTSTGAIRSSGFVQLGTSVSAYSSPLPIPSTANNAAITVDNSVAKTLTIGAAWSASAAGNTIQTLQYLIEAAI